MIVHRCTKMQPYFRFADLLRRIQQAEAALHRIVPARHLGCKDLPLAVREYQAAELPSGDGIADQRTWNAI